MKKKSGKNWKNSRKFEKKVSKNLEIVKNKIK